MHYGNKESQQRQCESLGNVLLENLGSCGLIQQHNAPSNIAEIVQKCFEEHEKEFKVLTWPLNSPNPNPIKHLWNVLDKQ
ncbi:hypothetical protein QTP70_024910, partial [Hemibagrus guttatus]